MAVVSSVSLSWAGLVLGSLAIGALVVVRDPPFKDVDGGRSGPAAGMSSDGEERRGSRDSEREKERSSDRDKEREAEEDDLPAGKDKVGSPPSAQTAEAHVPSAASRALAEDLEKRIRKNDLNGALAVFEALVESDKTLLKEKATREAVIDLSQRVTKLMGGQSQRFFNVLATKSGSHGHDILYYLVTAKGGSQASRDAARLLADPKIIKGGSEAMQVAYLLYKAPCPKKPEFFKRAGEHGDSRALGWLQALDGRRCRRGGCCIKDNKELDAAVLAMKARGVGE